MVNINKSICYESKIINLNAFGTHPDHVENRTYIKDAGFLAHIDELLAGDPTDEQLEEVRRTLFGTNKAWVPRWMFDDLVNSSSVPPTPPVPPIPQHDYIEIAGMKWATMNVGAKTIYDAGMYFQWGDTQGYYPSQFGTGERQKYFDWTDYKFNPSGDGTTFTKYNDTDNLKVLEPEDDAVIANWGNGWRMPLRTEVNTLINAVNIEWVENYNDSEVNGFVLTDKTDDTKVLFFPATGYGRYDEVRGLNTNFNMWVNFLAGTAGGTSGGVIATDFTITGNRRLYGHTIRGILDE